MKAIVFGDLGLDRYLICKARGLSAEAPIPILDQLSEVKRPGMAGNVAANLNALGVEGRLVRGEGNIPAKCRVMTEDGHQICRFDVADWCEEINPLDLSNTLSFEQPDVIVVADYAKGAITPRIVSCICGLIDELPLFVDTKRDPSPWMAAKRPVLFPNQSEYSQFKSAYDWFPHVILKQGALGLSYMQFGKLVVTRPALAKFVKSVNGAGDTVLAAFVAAWSKTGSVVEMMEFANMAAALVVEQAFDKRTTSLEAIQARYDELRETCPLPA